MKNQYRISIAARCSSGIAAGVVLAWILGCGTVTHQPTANEACVSPHAQEANTLASVANPATMSADEQMTRGAAAFGVGKYSVAAEFWQAAAAQYAADGNAAAESKAQANLGAACQCMGRDDDAIYALQHAVHLAEKAKDRGLQLSALCNLGGALAYTHDTKQSRTYLDRALTMARADGNQRMQMLVLNNLGNLNNTEKMYPEAMNAYKQSGELAAALGDRLALTKARTNAAASAAEAGSKTDCEQQATQALEALHSIPDGHEKALLLITLGRSFQSLAGLPVTSPDMAQRAMDFYVQAQSVANTQHDEVALSYALGYQGQVDESRGQLAAALRATQQARFAAQSTGDSTALYQWEWQAGRLLKAQGNTGEAIAAYDRAIQTLQAIRHDVAATYGRRDLGGTFRQRVGSIYFEYADLQLTSTESMTDQVQSQAMLDRARHTIELLKSAEMDDYFRDDCSALVQTLQKPIGQIATHTAVVYIIPLEDRTEILLDIGSGLKRFHTPVGTAQLTLEANSFRKHLEMVNSNLYLKEARQLYKWLITPIEKDLVREGVDTLVFVPDGALRNIPMAALQDGKDFLVAHYAVAVSPGLTLMEPKPINHASNNVLLSAVSESVGKYPALPYVLTEVEDVNHVFASKELINRDFRTESWKEEIHAHEYSIVHIASHGEFHGDARDTFILTYNSKLTLDDLERAIAPCQLRQHPVELLTLSACETAAGDDRAALGLAGVAIKAGVRSALATLWQVNDQASPQIIGNFYEEIRQNPNMTKAKALQYSQLRIMKDLGFHHPGFWSPYLIIGNWL